MYYNLVNTLKRRLILELQEGFSKHPQFEKIVPFIQNKSAFDERPQHGIVVKGSSSNKVQLSANNYLGVISSRVMLAYMEKQSHLLEWVREDSQVLANNQDVMPIQPGVYILECLSAPSNVGEVGTFAIDPFLTITDEPLLVSIAGVNSEAQLQQLPLSGTLRLWENRRIALKEGVDFDVDYRTGLVTFKTPLARGGIVTADYRYSVARLGPFNWKWDSASLVLSGVVMAFGRRGRVGDKVAVVVYDDRVDVAEAYGGRIDASFDMDVISRDTDQMERMADYAFMVLWGEKRPELSSEGFEIVDVSMGGESEEAYDETGDLMFYTGSLSVQIQSDWEIHIPLPLTTSRITQELAPVAQGLFFTTVPVTLGRNNEYERIS